MTASGTRLLLLFSEHYLSMYLSEHVHIYAAACPKHQLWAPPAYSTFPAVSLTSSFRRSVLCIHAALT